MQPLCMSISCTSTVDVRSHSAAHSVKFRRTIPLICAPAPIFMAEHALNNTRKRHRDAGDQEYTKQLPLAKKFKSFWDSLSKIRLTQRALEELERRIEPTGPKGLQPSQVFDQRVTWAPNGSLKGTVPPESQPTTLRSLATSRTN